MDKFYKMNEILKEIEEGYKNLTNKELSEIMLKLHEDFYNIKTLLVDLTKDMSDIEKIYVLIYEELQKRLNFKN